MHYLCQCHKLISEKSSFIRDSKKYPTPWLPDYRGCKFWPWLVVRSILFPALIPPMPLPEGTGFSVMGCVSWGEGWTEAPHLLWQQPRQPALTEATGYLKQGRGIECCTKSCEGCLDNPAAWLHANCFLSAVYLRYSGTHPAQTERTMKSTTKKV